MAESSVDVRLTRAAPAGAHHPVWVGVDWGILALVLAPFVVGIVAVLIGVGPSYHLVADNATNQLRMRDIGYHPVLTGPYSRDGWSHPGPMLYYLLLVPFRLLGSRSSGILVGALLVNGTAVAAAAATARRTGGRSIMLLTALAMSVVELNLGAVFVRDPWNPYLTVLAFGLVMISCWALACGRLWNLPVAVAVATFCVQSHIGYLPLAAPLLLFGGIGAALERRDQRGEAMHARRATAPILLAVAVAAVLWAPPLIDQVADTGNLNTARAYFTRGTATRGYDAAARVVGEEFTITPDWLTGREAPAGLVAEPQSLFRTPVPILGFIFLGIAALTWRRQRKDVRRLTVTVLIATAASLLAVARISGAIFDYRLGWLWVVGAMAVAGTLWMVARAWCAWPAGHRGFRIAVGAGLLATTIATSVAAISDEPPDARYQTRDQAIGRQVLHRLPSGPGSVIVGATSFVGGLGMSNLILRLEEAGIPVVVDPSRQALLSLGRHRLAGRRPARGRLTVLIDQDIDAFHQQPRDERLAYWGESPAQRRRDLLELRRLSRRAIRGDHSISTQERIRTLLRRTAALAVFFSPAGTPARAVCAGYATSHTPPDSSSVRRSPGPRVACAAPN